LFKKGFDQGLFNLADSRNLEGLTKNLPAICSDEPASLIHGDLWSGNMLCSGHLAYLIDPSASYAHREMDIAMTKLFGGFDPNFYSAYQEVYPLLPNFESRREIYQLYYLLVHAILFKGGYIQSVKNLLNKFGK
jgi:fructosamine-3-kinase